jgi:hypothetical protein
MTGQKDFSFSQSDGHQTASINISFFRYTLLLPRYLSNVSSFSFLKQKMKEKCCCYGLARLVTKHRAPCWVWLESFDPHSFAAPDVVRVWLFIFFLSSLYICWIRNGPAEPFSHVLKNSKIK